MPKPRLRPLNPLRGRRHHHHDQATSKKRTVARDSCDSLTPAGLYKQSGSRANQSQYTVRTKTARLHCHHHCHWHISAFGRKQSFCFPLASTKSLRLTWTGLPSTSFSSIHPPKGSLRHLTQRFILLQSKKILSAASPRCTAWRRTTPSPLIAT